MTHFDIVLEGKPLHVVCSSDEFGIDVEEVYAADSKVEISYILDAWHPEIINLCLEELRSWNR